jgi:hypothetical protein
MVKDSRKGSGASEMAIFGELAGLSTRRNVDNELFVLQARRLMTQVVKELGLTTSYSTRVNLRKVDLYRCSPVSATFINDTDELTCAFKLELGEESFTLYDFTMPSANDEEIDYDGLTFTAPYGSTIATPAGELVVDKTLFMDDKCVGKVINVVKYRTQAVTTRYCKAMKSAVANKMS